LFSVTPIDVPVKRATNPVPLQPNLGFVRSLKSTRPTHRTPAAVPPSIGGAPPAPDDPPAPPVVPPAPLVVPAPPPVVALPPAPAAPPVAALVVLPLVVAPLVALPPVAPLVVASPPPLVVAPDVFVPAVPVAPPSESALQAATSKAAPKREKRRIERKL
jgi:hypothetical protein